MFKLFIFWLLRYIIFLVFNFIIYKIIYIMTTKLIQLREADDMSKQDGATGGNFSAVLQEPLYLEKGDSIRMKSAFLSDITANQNTVVFPEELTVTFYIARYFRDWGSYEVAANYNTRVRGGIGGNRQLFSNKDFVLC